MLNSFLVYCGGDIDRAFFNILIAALIFIVLHLNIISQALSDIRRANRYLMFSQMKQDSELGRYVRNEMNKNTEMQSEKEEKSPME